MLPAAISLNDARIQLQTLLLNAVKKRIKRNRSGILFSGGLDSTVLAKLSQGVEPAIPLYCTGFSNSKDLLHAKETAAILELPLRTIQLELDIVEDALPKILTALVEPTIMDLAIAIPLYFAAQFAKTENKTMVLCGQGADESLGGYKRYEDILAKNGYDTLHSCLQNDVLDLFGSLKREFTIATLNRVEFGFPFLDRDVLQFVFPLPAEYKILHKNSTFVRKYILRLVAKDIGLPPLIYDRPKLAAQFGSGAQKALDKLARINGFTRHLSRQYGYHNHIRMYVDYLAYDAGLPISASRNVQLLQFLKDTTDSLN